MDEKLYTYTDRLARSKFSFDLHTGQLTNYINIDHQVCLRDFNLKSIKFIIGLNFIIQLFQGCIILPTGISFAAAPYLHFTSDVVEKRGGTICQDKIFLVVILAKPKLLALVTIVSHT